MLLLTNFDSVTAMMYEPFISSQYIPVHKVTGKIKPKT